MLTLTCRLEEKIVTVFQARERLRLEFARKPMNAWLVSSHVQKGGSYVAYLKNVKDKSHS